MLAMNCYNYVSMNTQMHMMIASQTQMLITFNQMMIQNEKNAKEAAEKTDKIFKEIIEKAENADKNAKEAVDKANKVDKNSKEATAHLKYQVVKLSKEVTDVNARYYELVHTLSAREIGTSADRYALNEIFPNCRGKNFGIRTLAELKMFLDNKDLNNKSVSPTAKTSWMNLLEQERDLIKDRYDKMLNAHPGLINHIKKLKGQCYYAHRITGNGKTEYKYFSVINNKLIAEAIRGCLPLVPQAELNR